jgi:hypothetical protein
MDEAKTEVLAFTAFPRPHWSKIWSTNPLERVNKEIKRRVRVVGIFPDQDAVIRLVGAVLADMHDEWQAGDRRGLSEGSMAKLYPGTEEHLKAHHPAGLCRRRVSDVPPRPASTGFGCHRATALRTAVPVAGDSRLCCRTCPLTLIGYFPARRWVQRLCRERHRPSQALA